MILHVYFVTLPAVCAQLRGVEFLHVLLWYVDVAIYNLLNCSCYSSLLCVMVNGIFDSLGDIPQLCTVQ